MVDTERSFFEAQFKRLYSVTGARTQTELANVLGIRQSSVSDARRRGKIPSDWLICLVRTKNVHPEWILTGKGPHFIGMETGLREIYGGTTGGEEAEEDTLRHVPSRRLTEELLRRIAAVPADAS